MRSTNSRSSGGGVKLAAKLRGMCESPEESSRRAGNPLWEDQYL